MTIRASRAQRGAANLSVILVIAAAALILIFVLVLRRGSEPDTPTPVASAPRQESMPTAPPVEPARAPSRATAPSDDSDRPEVLEPERVAVAPEGERLDTPPNEADVPRYDPGSSEIPPQIAEAMEHPPEMPESLRSMIDRGEVNQVPPEMQQLLDGPRPTVSASELDQLERQATEIDMPPDVREQFEEAGRRMNEGRQ